MRWPRSILARILLLHIIAIAIAALSMPIILHHLLEAQTSFVQRTFMQRQAELLAQYIERDESGQSGKEWRLALPSSIDDLYSAGYGRYWYSILSADHRVLFSSDGVDRPIFPPNSQGGVANVVSGDESISVVGVSRRVSRHGSDFIIQVAEYPQHEDVIIDDIVTSFLTNVGWVVAPLLGLLLVVDVLIFRKMLRPLRQVSEQAANYSLDQSTVRLNAEGLPSEIVPLVRAVNDALGRIETSYNLHRDFSADAAHELRTPLAILRAKIELLDDAKARASLLSIVDAMTHVLTQLMHLAEVEVFVLESRETTDLHKVASDLIEMMAPLALDQRKEIELLGHEGAVMVLGNEILIGRALRNLLDNAIRFSPDDRAIELSVEADGSVAVTDYGPGVNASDRERILQRFWRKDRSAHGHAGLGLSIVQKICKLHQAEFSMQHLSPQGVRMVLKFRRAPDAQAALVEPPDRRELAPNA